MEEHRKFRRFPFREAVQYRLAAEQESAGCLACDFSASGIRIRVEDFIPPGTEMSLDVTLPTEHVLQVKGCVAWAQRIPHGEMYNLGIEFKSIEGIPPISQTVPQMFSAR